ncbi:imidazolonepropionase [Gudongella oleilytica]|jgi:imidazolonepropionase|uniref:imidazolonepropionase n=1 Tax=Gudongella oleilytica TaxID=1582259 RepID=UPI000FF8922A|nr:imidazolonepropionase [Gudongella oleilytica]MDY0257702.1 imidazolonepropionase [Gudongella oleilytica]HMM69688.1 imidazolonepropionase [Gudongella oleilytica]
MDADLIIKNIGTLVTLKGPQSARGGSAQGEISVIKDAAVAVRGDRIIYVGTGSLPEDVTANDETLIIDANGKLVTPGLVDSHTHLVHGGSRENELSMKLKGAKYMEILSAGGGIHSTMRATRSMSKDELYLQARRSLDRMLSFGVTTVEGKSGYGIEDIETELKQLEVARRLNNEHAVDVVSTFMGAHAIPLIFRDDPEGFVQKIIKEMIPTVAKEKLAKFCDVFCEHGVFTIDQSRRILLEGRQWGLKPKIHADEIESIGGAELAAELGCVSADHLVGASDEGIMRMAESGVVANLLPGTSFNLQTGKHARARFMIEKGLPVAISTDYNPGSCPTENIQLVMSFASLILRMTPEEVLTAVTMNGAAALGLEREIGSIEVGKKADLVIFDSTNLEYVIYHFGINHTDMVIKDGRVAFSKKDC